MVTDGRFFNVRMLNVEVQADGTLTGNPIAGRPGSPATLTANALYMLESCANASKARRRRRY